jgi:thiol-disulfide isomerase/thioredoxin
MRGPFSTFVLLLAVSALVGCAGPGGDSRVGSGGGAGGGAAREARPPAPLVVTDMQGVTHDLDRALADGKAVALVWWQTWCASCKREAPALVAAAEQYRDRVTFVGIVPGEDSNVDDGKVRATEKELGLNYPTVRDRDLALTRAFGIEGTPTIVVLRGTPAEVVYRGHQPPDFGALAAGVP